MNLIAYIHQNMLDHAYVQGWSKEKKKKKEAQ